MSSTWFEKLFGFVERGQSYEQIQRSFTVSTNSFGVSFLKSHYSSYEFNIGSFSTPTLGELRREGVDILLKRKESVLENNGTIKLGIKIHHHAVNDILKLHGDNIDAVFQAASQFNCLEFAGPDVTPEDGVDIYYYDQTQGPACALACGAGTVFRNYFVRNQDGSRGQRADMQINNLDRLESAIDNNSNKYWEIRNGYSFSDARSLAKFRHYCATTNCNILRDLVKCGVHRDVGVTLSGRDKIHPALGNVRNYPNGPPTVTQVYCSAISCSYSGVSNDLWEPIARLTLEANYEATLWAAITTSRCPGRRFVHLTFLGGGVFGNAMNWITDAMGRALAILAYEGADLDVVICHYRKVDERVKEEISQAYERHLSQLRAGGNMMPSSSSTALAASASSRSSGGGVERGGGGGGRGGERGGGVESAGRPAVPASSSSSTAPGSAATTTTTTSGSRSSAPRRPEAGSAAVASSSPSPVSGRGAVKARTPTASRSTASARERGGAGAGGEEDPPTTCAIL